MNGFDKIRELFDDLLAPFQDLADYIRSAFMDMSDSFTSLDYRKKMEIEEQKSYRKHMDNQYRIQYKQSSFVKVVPRNRPYQRRSY